MCGGELPGATSNNSNVVFPRWNRFAFGLMFGNVFYKVLHLAMKIVICASCFALVKQQDALFFSDWLFYHPSFPYMGINCETDHLRPTPYLVLWELRKLHLRSQ